MPINPRAASRPLYDSKMVITVPGKIDITVRNKFISHVANALTSDINLKSINNTKACVEPICLDSDRTSFKKKGIEKFCKRLKLKSVPQADSNSEEVKDKDTFRRFKTGWDKEILSVIDCNKCQNTECQNTEQHFKFRKQLRKALSESSFIILLNADPVFDREKAFSTELTRLIRDPSRYAKLRGFYFAFNKGLPENFEKTFDNAHGVNVGRPIHIKYDANNPDKDAGSDDHGPSDSDLSEDERFILIGRSIEAATRNLMNIYDDIKDFKDLTFVELFKEQVLDEYFIETFDELKLDDYIEALIEKNAEKFYSKLEDQPHALEAQKPFAGVRKSGSAWKYYLEHYGYWHDKGMIDRGLLRQFDRKLMEAIETWCKVSGEASPADLFPSVTQARQKREDWEENKFNLIA